MFETDRSNQNRDKFKYQTVKGLRKLGT